MKGTIKDILQDALICEKFMIDAYAKFIMEASCRPLIDVLTTNASQIIATQHAIFKEMEARGLYPLKYPTLTEMEQVISQNKADK